jgi:hypothetical protein
VTAIAKPRPLRMNQRAQLVPAAQFARWHEIAAATAGLSELDRQISAIGALDGLFLVIGRMRGAVPDFGLLGLI